MINKVKESVKGLNCVLTEGSLSATKRSWREMKDVSEAIRNFTPSEGWLCFTDRVVLLDALEVDTGILLSAELVNENKSLHIRQQGDGWVGWFYSCDSNSESKGILVEQSFLGTRKTQGKKLCYQTFWTEDNYGSLQPVISRFSGFCEGR